MTTENQQAWIIEAIRALRKVGSWTGQIHIQKLLFTVQVLKLADPPFTYGLYHYGPYSRDLDTICDWTEAEFLITRQFPRPDYGPQYDVSTLASCKLNTHDLKAIEKVAKQFGKKKSQDLELIATCLWVELNENKADDNEIIKRIRSIKPHYTENQIQQQLVVARKMKKDLCSTTN